MMPSNTLAANNINPTIKTPITISKAGMIFSKSIDFFGMRDVSVARVELGMLTLIDLVLYRIFSTSFSTGSM
jgi:hypothetical protein